MDGANKIGELAGLECDSAGQSSGTIGFQVVATNSGGSVMSDVVSATVISASATVPGSIADGDWTLSDAAAGGALSVVISAIPGGGNGLIELGLSSNADDVGLAVWAVGNRTFVGANAGYFANRKTDLPADLSIDTIAGDVVLAAVMHGSLGASSNWNGVTETVASRVLTDRVFAAANNLSATGATPETFEWLLSLDWIGVGAALAVYR